VNWTELFDMQRKLDAYIKKNHQLEEADLFSEKILALLVELGELANETRSFKYWSTKAASDREVILEEYVDNVHFLLSLGIEKNYQFTHIEVEETKNNMVEQFNEVYRKAIYFSERQSEVNYKELVEAYLQLANLLGFTEQAILNAYIEKNEVNYERQQSGY